MHNAHLKGIIGKITNTPLFDKIKALEPQVSAKVYLIIKDLAQGSEDKLNSIITELSISSKKFDDIVQEARGLIGKYDWDLIKDYFQFIQQITGRSIGKKQIDKLKDALRAKEYTKLSASDYKKHTDQFTLVVSSVRKHA